MVESRQVKLAGHVYFDNSREMVLHIECVKEHAPKNWPKNKRYSVVMIGVGQQIGKDYWITQWASNWERELMDAARPTLALASTIYTESRSNFDIEVLAGKWISATERWDDQPLWPFIDVSRKVVNVRDLLREQQIGPAVNRVGDIKSKQVVKYWRPRKGQDRKRMQEYVWKHNYLDILESTERIFQIEWPK